MAPNQTQHAQLVSTARGLGFKAPTLWSIGWIADRGRASVPLRQGNYAAGTVGKMKG
jgi:hypothetical protein